MMLRMKNQLDERQEQALLKIEHNGCWLAFWGLLAALVVQQALGAQSVQLAGEWVVFMTLACYLWFGCLREGIWDRTLRPTAKTNALLSLAPALVCGGLMFARVYSNYPDALAGSIAAGVFVAGSVYLLCLLALSLSVASYHHRLAQLEAEPEDDE